MQNDTARTVSTCTIWGAMAIIFTSSGIFDGQGTMAFWVIRMLMVGAIAGAAGWSTAAIWRRHPKPDAGSTN